MTITEFNFHKSRFYPVLAMEKIFSHRNRHRVWNFLKIILVVMLVLIIIGATEQVKSISLIFTKIVGLFLVFLSFAVFAFLWECFFRSFYLKEKSDLIVGDSNNFADYLGFESARLVFNSSKRNSFDGFSLTKNFLKSSIGELTMFRSGITARSAKEILKKLNNKNIVPVGGEEILKEAINIAQKNNRQLVFAEDLITALFRKEKIFSDLIFEIGVKENELIGALKWAVRSNEQRKTREGWWRKESLGKISGLAKDWAYGQTYLLSKYGRNMSAEADALGVLNLSGRTEQIKQMEIVLSRKKGANVLVVGEPGTGRSITILGLDKTIMSGKIVPALEHKIMIDLDTDGIIASTKEKGEFESLIIKIFNEAVSIGNILLVIDNFISFLKSASALGSDIPSLIAPYLDSKDLQIIVVSDFDGFHRVLESNADLMKFFEKVEIREPNKENLLVILEQVAEDAERDSKIIFTFSAVEEIIQMADQYLVKGVMPEKAIGLMAQVISSISNRKEFWVRKNDVKDVVRFKTNIPVGEIDDNEKEKLLKLEEFLHQRVIGQDSAISAISEVMRRARAEVRDTKKPIGSFLFLGPTGVGKTETAKALAETFFGDEKNIIRFDMSEYQTGDAVNRLIGSFSENKPGIFANALREKPYGLVLMDEFEKTNPEALNLFLQILDEGFFTDAFGKKVNCRNVIFIATSNAGADLIWNFVKQGVNPVDKREEIIDKIRGTGIFKPELLNRFDGIIVYHPLEKKHLEAIAKLMLNKLSKRLKEKDIELAITPALVENITKLGYDPVFGARPMQRAIQDKIENQIAQKIISGEVSRGSKIEFNDII